MTKKIIIRIVYISFTILVFAGCSEKDNLTTRSMEEIRRSEGVPVNVREIEETTFATRLGFTSTLTGLEESTATSMLSDEVAAVLYKVGDYIEQGTSVVLFPPDNPSLNYEQTRVSFESTRQAYERIRRLYEGDGVSQQEYDNARTQYELARANWETAQRMAAVRAPISGYITRITVSESENVQQGDPLFTVSAYDELKSTVWLTDSQVHEVEVGQPAYAVWQDLRLEGTVTQVDIAMDQTKKAFAVKLRFDNPDRLVRSGVTAQIDIETYRNDRAIVVGQQELLSDSDGSYVFALRDERAYRQPVAIGRRQGLDIEIIAGLSVGDRLITTGNDQVADGTLVRVVDDGSEVARQ